VFAHLRIAVTMMPRWSGLRLTNNDCLLPNIPQMISGSFKNEDSIDKSIVDADCWICESVHGVRRFNVSDAKLISQLTAWNRPMLISPNNHSLRRTTIPEIMQEIGKAYRDRPESEPFS